MDLKRPEAQMMEEPDSGNPPGLVDFFCCLSMAILDQRQSKTAGKMHLIAYLQSIWHCFKTTN